MPSPRKAAKKAWKKPAKKSVPKADWERWPQLAGDFAPCSLAALVSSCAKAVAMRRSPAGDVGQIVKGWCGAGELGEENSWPPDGFRD
jgi:hypothetical protein